ncbi:MAG: type I-E CRISPR-associated protein Cas7/Cse4/CasC [Cellulomonadaceae bacterium]|jgi:CRISPR system Cascade subunit CasC|nr:type I-E CRISPR-associated protein Cas7/Cse4/CasC [Cellulomonadaceae bacterium]
MNRTYIDIHLVQSVPPSNLNRDDTGSPKTATYGGVRRARVSSQAWKRAVRQEFAELLDTTELGVRTKRVVEVLADRIESTHGEIERAQALDLAKQVLTAAGIKVAEPKGKKGAPEESGYLLFLSALQISALARFAVESWETDEQPDKKQAKALLQQGNSVDLALFGRMVADVSDLNVDAACQVAHALSTHAVETEYDYFTAVDDQKAASEDEDAGAGMIGTVEFNSATLYRYATINANMLRENLGDISATERAVDAFIRAFIHSMPTGKQNTFANRTLPAGVVISVRGDQPISYVGAFEDPVRVANTGGSILTSAEKLAAYATDITAAYGSEALLTRVVGLSDVEKKLSSLGEVSGLDNAVAAVTEFIVERLGEAASPGQS